MNDGTRGRLVTLTVILASTLTAGIARADLPPGCAELGFALTEHSCFHATFGPYSTVTAASGVPAPAVAPDIDDVHTYYDIVLPNPTGDNTVSYRVASAARAGTWAIFHDAQVPIRVLSEAGIAQPVVLSHDVSSCPFLPRVDVFELGFERYRIVLGPATVARSVLVVEHISDFIQLNGRDADGDGYGDSEDTVITACVPATGYVQNALDCDDANPNIRPGAVEICDGIDQNCNGSVDDIGFPCTSGLGQCRASGTMQCPMRLEPAVCSAVPSAPESETCDGVDENCDGVPDLEEGGLCTEPDAPSCVLVLGVTRCGCVADSDCGGSSSGRICDLAERLCIAGCVALPGRNGCPVGLVCTSDDPAALGTCAPLEAGCTNGTECGDGEICDVARGECIVASTRDAGIPDAGASDAGSDAGGGERLGGCDCTVGRHSSPKGGIWLVVGLVGVIAWRRRVGPRVATAAMMLAMPFALTGCYRVNVSDIPEDAGEVVNDSPLDASPPEACVPELERRVVGHACSHGTHGPFENVVASDGTASLPSVSLTHRTYEILMPSDAPPWAGAVTYTPTRDGQHVIFTSPRVELRLFSESEEVAVIHREEIIDAACAALDDALVVPLSLGEPIRIEISDTPEREVKVFIEHLGTFADHAWASDCTHDAAIRPMTQ